MPLSLKYTLAFLVAILALVVISWGSEKPPAKRRATDEADAQLLSLWEASSRNQADTSLGRRVVEELVARLEKAGEIEAHVPHLQGMKDLLAPDGLLRVLSWQHEMGDRSYLYMGVVAYRAGRRGELRVVALEDRQLPVGDGNIKPEWERMSFGPAEWLGAGYYDIQDFSYADGQNYLLLGIAGGSPFVQRRVVETLEVRPDGTLRFGVPAIRDLRSRRCRLLFSYNARVAMTVHLLDNRRVVLLDHLSPASGQYRGMPQFYGPDFSQDALRLLSSGEWRLEKDVVVEAPRDGAHR
ncbi:MAG: hypothetical protein CSA97_04065 [Bacteroidetes bacterium]|nr:MAG: hypothetical protein CSA97_04065 [Bacteroidota bacterium]